MSLTRNTRQESRRVELNWQRGIFVSKPNARVFDNPRTRRLHSTARRTAFGSLATMGTTGVNLLIGVVIGSEPAWLCLMLCKFDGWSSSWSARPSYSFISSFRCERLGQDKWTTPDGPYFLCTRKLTSNQIVFICAIILHWITHRDTFGSDCKQMYRRRRPWGTARAHPVDACSKVPGLCCSGLQGTTLLTSCAVPGPSRARDADILTHHVHPGSLVPGSMYFGRVGQSVENISTSDTHT